MIERSMRYEDGQAVAVLEGDLNPTPWTEAMFLEELRLGSFCRVLTDEVGTVVGYLVARLLWDEWHLLLMGVAVGYQRRGWGHRLMREWMDHARKNVGRSLLLEVRRSNRSAIKLYSDFGFVTVGVRKKYYHGPHGSEDAWVMARPISSDDQERLF
ncbi:MAG: ribosomal protein S18-alanine N-acetyltransferase [Magnetococcales bacterium]|nr:ribosomal protein S18-alanine N-acetyltransferase [Magnetococcales bacterium]